MIEDSSPIDLIAQAAEAFGSAVALRHLGTGQVLSFAELEELTRCYRFDEASTFSIIMPNSWDFLVGLYAALRWPVLLNPISPRVPAEAAAAMAPVPIASVFPSDEASTTPPGRTLDEPCTLLFSSGSSGHPKGVMHALRAHLASASGSQSRLPLSVGDGWLLSLPVYHISGFSILIRCLLSGATVVIPATNSLDGLSSKHVSHASVVATQLIRLLAAAAEYPNLKAILVGGGPVPGGVVTQAILAGLPVHLTYGMTETASQITTTPRLVRTADRYSCGTVLPSREIRISPRGEIQVRGEVLCLSYWLNGQKINPFLPDGWFPTRDTGYLDANGALHVLGRTDRMFISGGENIYPEEIESVLHDIPGVQRAVVVPRADVEFGARPIAFVAGADLSDPYLRNQLREHLPGFKVPAAFLPWPDHISVDQPKVAYAVFAALAEVDRASGTGS